MTKLREIPTKPLIPQQILNLLNGQNLEITGQSASNLLIGEGSTTGWLWERFSKEKLGTFLRYSLILRETWPLRWVWLTPTVSMGLAYSN